MNTTSTTYLATWGLGEPQGPCVHERVLDVEVLGVVENSDNVTILRSGFLVDGRGSAVLGCGRHDCGIRG